MFLLIAGVKFPVVGRLVGDHLEEDFEESLSQTSEGAGMAHALVSFFLVVGLAPDHSFSETIGPEMKGVSQEFVAGPADMDLIEFAGLEAHGRGAGIALQHVGASVAFWIRADGRQEARGQDHFCAWQTAEEVVIGVMVEERLDLLAVFVELLLEGAQEFAQAYGQLALGLGDRSRGLELIGLGKEGQTFFGGFRAPEFVGVKELFPATLAGLNQRLRGGKADDEVPGERTGPIVKGLEGCGKILHQGLLKLVDQEGALLDQADFIMAQEAQLLGERIHGLESFPAVAVDAEGVGQAPGIEVIGLGAAGGLAFAITFRGHRIDRIEGIGALQELIDRGALVGFDRHGQVGPGGGFLLKGVPAFQRVFEFKIGNDFALRIDDDQGVVIAGPIEAGVVGDVLPILHTMSFLGMHRGAVVRRPDTRSLAGCCSLRRWDGRLPTGR
jgi:hypothetical protein